MEGTLSVWRDHCVERRSQGRSTCVTAPCAGAGQGTHVRGARGKGVRFTGMAPVAYRSSEWAERGFCPTCGTHLFYHLLPTDEYILSAGLFQDQGFELTGQIFIDEKPDFYALKNDTPTLTGQQVFEQFAPNPEPVLTPRRSHHG